MVQLTVISPVYNDTHFPEIVKGYARQDIDGGQYEVIFVASNPSNSQRVSGVVAEAAKTTGRNLKCLVIHGASNCTSRNLAVKEAQGNLLVFADGDQFVHSSLVRQHLETVKEGQAGIGIINIDIEFRGVHGLVRVQPFNTVPGHYQVVEFGRTGPEGQSAYITRFVESLTLTQAIGFAGFHNRNDVTDYINFITRNCSMFKKDYLELGGFDEELGYSATSVSRGWEDVELGLRIHEHGIKFVFVPTWAVHPRHPEMMKDSGWANMILMCKKHPWFVAQRKDWFKMHRYNYEEVLRQCGM